MKNAPAQPAIDQNPDDFDEKKIVAIVAAFDDLVLTIGKSEESAQEKLQQVNRELDDLKIEVVRKEIHGNE